VALDHRIQRLRQGLSFFYEALKNVFPNGLVGFFMG
jgi:hypothetical protein